MKGYLRIASIMPKIKVGNPSLNVESIKEEILKANTLGTKICALPDLSISGNFLCDLFNDSNIYYQCLQSLYSLITFSNELDMIIIVSAPLKINDMLYDIAFVIKSGKILGALQNNSFNNNDINSCYFSNKLVSIEHYVLHDEERDIRYDFPINNNLVFKNNNIDFTIVFNSNFTYCENASLYFNLDSIPETIYIDNVYKHIKQESIKSKSAIVTVSPGPSETSTRYSFFGRSFVFECGELIAKNEIISNHILLSDIDLDKIYKHLNNNYIRYDFDNFISTSLSDKLYRNFDSNPYILNNSNSYNYSMHIINILALALAKRLDAIKCKNIVLGLSGGLDSTMAIIIAKKTIEYMSLNKENIFAISMPCFGTSDSSLNNVKNLSKALDIDLKEINISNAVTLHLNDINHDINNTNITYENAQARERTQILMDIANDINGIVIGTSDLSEIALGYSTYNGDQMSMYNINASLPKTLIKYMLNAIADENINNKDNSLLATTLKSILSSPISPELLPTENGMILQKTEDIIGNYEIHDFVLYYYLKYHYDIKKLTDLAIRTFVYNSNEHKFTEDYVRNCINLFFKRFYKAQYKRSATADSPDIGLPNLNAQYSYKIPADNEVNII